MKKIKIKNTKKYKEDKRTFEISIKNMSADDIYPSPFACIAWIVPTLEVEAKLLDPNNKTYYMVLFDHYSSFYVNRITKKDDDMIYHGFRCNNTNPKKEEYSKSAMELYRDNIKNALSIDKTVYRDFISTDIIEDGRDYREKAYNNRSKDEMAYINETNTQRNFVKIFHWEGCLWEYKEFGGDMGMWLNRRNK